MAKCSNVQFTGSLYDNMAVQRPMTWDMICNMVRNPRNLWDRSEAELWSFYILRNPSVFSFIGNKEAVDKVIAMQIDFDDGRTIESFIKEFSEYRFVLYTSKSHSKYHHKFRVVMPLNKPFPNAIYSSKSNRALLASMFKGCDKTTFDAWRKQRVPHIVSNSQEYLFHINDGAPYVLDFDYMLELYNYDKQLREARRTACYSSMDIDPFNTPLEEWNDITMLNNLCNNYSEVLSRLDYSKRGAGEDIHSNLRTVAYSLRKHGMDERLVYSFIMQFNPLNEKEVHDLCYGDIL